MQRFVTVLSFLIYLLIFSKPIKAETMYSDSFQLRFGNFNMTSGTKTSTNYSLTDTVGQTVANEFTSSGYSIGAGAQYAYLLYEFSFAISKTDIDLGSVSIGSFATDTLDLTVTAPRQGYTVTTIAATPLQKGSDTIPMTSCDTSCTTGSAGVWINANNPGFGYNITGQDIAPDFANSTYFRPFPDLSLGDTPATVMTTTESGQARTATATYQLAIDQNQATGNYETLIYYIATPNY